MTEFSVFLKGSKNFEALDIALKDDTARVKTADYEWLFEIWSHNQRINGLHCTILEAGGKAKLDELVKLYGDKTPTGTKLKDDSIVKQLIEEYELDNPQFLPNSFKYPTMQVKNNILPLLNQVGAGEDDRSNPQQTGKAGCLVQDNDNRAHLRAAKKEIAPANSSNSSNSSNSLAPVTFDSEQHTKELIQHHKKYREKMTITGQPAKRRHPDCKPSTSKASSQNHKKPRQANNSRYDSGTSGAKRFNN